jgi:hypothetical protein
VVSRQAQPTSSNSSINNDDDEDPSILEVIGGEKEVGKRKQQMTNIPHRQPDTASVPKRLRAASVAADPNPG